MKENSSSTQLEEWEEEKSSYFATLQLLGLHGVAMAIHTAIELDIFNILATAGPDAELTAGEIVASFPNCRPGADFRLERVLRFLASHGVLRCSAVAAVGGDVQRRYGLEPMYGFLVKNQDGVSLAPAFHITRNIASLVGWKYLKDAVLDDIDPFAKLNGMTTFEYAKKDKDFGEHFNQFMASITKLTSEKIVEAYKEGFKQITTLVDIGGGVGAMLGAIVSKHPHIKGINFDLPHVVSTAIKFPGVEHVGGDFFVGNYPNGDAILLKWILHDWGDEDCVTILKKCYEALPPSGRVIVVEQILPEIPERKDDARYVHFMDLSMMVSFNRARERSEREYKALAFKAGFADFKIACSTFNYYVMELLKN